MELISYIGTLILAIYIGLQLGLPIALTLAFAFVCWYGGWSARGLSDRRRARGKEMC